MKFEVTVEINCPRAKVVELFRSVEGMKAWQDKFISMEPISGEPDQNGAQAMIKYKFREGIMELKETVLENNLPDHFEGLYEHKAMVNTMKSVFIEIAPKKTRYISYYEYTIFRGLIPKIMSWIMPGMFKKQARKWMIQFKDYVENA